MYCYKCGKTIDDEAVICPHCGCATKNFDLWGHNHSKAKNCDGIASRKSRLVALLLCIFLGWIGVHRYYIGKIGTGVLWMLTGGCFYIGWIIDIIFIACGKMTDKDGNLILSWDGASASNATGTITYGQTNNVQSPIAEELVSKEDGVKHNRWYGVLRIVLGVIYIGFGIVQVLVFYQSGLISVMIGAAVTIWGIADRKNKLKQNH